MKNLGFILKQKKIKFKFIKRRDIKRFSKKETKYFIIISVPGSGIYYIRKNDF